MDKSSWKTFADAFSFVIVFVVPVILYLMEKAGVDVTWIFILGWSSIAAAAVYLAVNIPWVWSATSSPVQVWRICFVCSAALLIVGYGAIRIWPAQPPAQETAPGLTPSRPTAKDSTDVDVRFGNWDNRPPDLRFPRRPDVLTLRWLFKEDFPQYWIATTDTTLLSVSDQPDRFESQIYIDLPGRAQFVGFYLPPSVRTYQVCLTLPDVVDPLVKHFTENVGFEGGSIGASRTKFADLSPTGRIYVYYDGSLSLQQIAEIDAAFSSRHLGLILRGLDWLQFQTLSRREVKP